MQMIGLFCFLSNLKFPSLILAKRPMRQGVMVEFRNDLLLDDKKFTAILNDFSQFLGEIIEENKSIEEQKKKEKE